ncbi:MAG: ATP-binding protein [Lachnospiraceae bacterium]|nr:ATP-binding protein [Lachnospiraceae bacterium]
MSKPLPIGVENFEMICTEEYYYVDKTLMVKEILEKKSSVNLFTRPRRFGKTLTLSMLQYYFEDVYDVRGNKKDYSYLFEDKKILKEDEKYRKHMGHYPVISLTLKSGKQAAFEGCMTALINNLAEEFERHSYILKDCIMSPKKRERFEAYMDGEASIDEYKDSLKFLCHCLKEWHGEKVIILLDEYDVPLEGAYQYGFYDKMADFIRGLFEAALKTNNSLYFAVITGCLRISKESIFTGLNNLDINSILTVDYGEYFGFTEPEVMKMCRDYELEDKFQEMKNWYNGYLFGDTNVYNPWSCIKYIKTHVSKRDAYPEAYWVNTSSNAIVRDLIERADDSQKQVIEDLIAGGEITIPVHEDITYDEIYKSTNNLWNFMFFAGYFKKTGESFADTQKYITIRIPNYEVKHIYKEKVLSWFEEKVKETDRSALFTAIVKEDTAGFSRELQGLLQQTISFHDFYENFYHGFVAGVLTGMKGYIIKSNREGGNGRSDIFVYPIDKEEQAFVLEFKIASSIKELPQKAKEAVEQIIEREYEQELRDLGYINIKRYGIAFFSKNCLVISE